jgi:uncharacterized cupin superfamily protein
VSDDPNILTPKWEYEAPAPRSARAARVGAKAGAQELGATLYELDPGGQVSPYHLHHGNEELLVVVAGRPLLRTPEGLRQLEPGAVVAFPAGADGAHRISNPSDEPVRVLVLSTMRFPDVVVHLDTGTTLTATGPATGKAYGADGERDVMGAIDEALAAAAAVEARYAAEP